MSRFTLPGSTAQHAHGTRARYVLGCRCAACRASNVAAYHERQARAKEAVREISTPAAGPIAKTWTAPDGSKRPRTYSRACPGVDGEICRWRSHLRKDSTGGVCHRCRARLVWDGLVDAAPVRRHLRALSRRGVGYKTVAAASDVGHTTIAQVLGGTKSRIRKRSADAILAVTVAAVADHALVPAGLTWRMLRKLEPEYLTKGRLAQALGCKRPALQISRRRVLARTELRVRRLYRRAFGVAT